MSYVDEILTIGRTFRGNTTIVEDESTETGPSNSDLSLWTLVSTGEFSYKRNKIICCFDNTSRQKCIVDTKRLLGSKILGSNILQDVQYSWEQYDIAIFCKGSIFDPENLIGGAVITRPIIIKQTTGSIAKVVVPGATDTLLNITVNGVVYGTILYGASSASGVVNISQTIEVSDGDVIGIISTNLFDSTAEDYVITLSGLAQNVEIWDTIT